MVSYFLFRFCISSPVSSAYVSLREISEQPSRQAQGQEHKTWQSRALSPKHCSEKKHEDNLFFKYYKLLMKNGAQWVNVTIIYHHATIIQWDLEYYLFLTMSSQPLIEEVGNLINSSIDWVPQAIQDHPNHLLFQIYWTKMRREEKPWPSRIFLQEQSPQSCRRQRAWRPSLLHLETWIMVMVMMMRRSMD